MVSGRALHYVLKVADRTTTAHFYRNVLGMKVLRHEEFKEGCEAQCNGPYDNRWSKTMIGYGPEDTHFVIELTYNYGVESYKKGNDFLGITIKSSEAIERAKINNWPIIQEDDQKILEAPGGYRFYIIDEPQPANSDPVVKVKLASSDIQRSIDYWNATLGLKIFEKSDKSVIVGFDAKQAKLEFIDIGGSVDHAAAYGRIAFSCPHNEQENIVSNIEKAKQKILTPLTSLDTPGKATVRVVILADPDGHEICFVDDEAFKELSKVDPEGEELLTRYIKLDKSRGQN